MTIYPLKLKDTPDRYVVVALDHKTPFFIRKDAAETAAVLTAVRGALDLIKNVVITTAADDPHRIVAAQIEHPEERAAPRCPDREELTPAFFSKQESIPSLPRDQIRWVATVPGCSSYRVSFSGPPRLLGFIRSIPGRRQCWRLHGVASMRISLFKPRSAALPSDSWRTSRSTEN